MFVALCGDKGAPGVTTSALALASAWPGPAVVVEASPAGGDLAIRLHPKGAVLPETPTVLSVVTASRATREQDPVSDPRPRPELHDHGGAGAVLAEQMANIGDWSPLADALGRTRVARVRRPRSSACVVADAWRRCAGRRGCGCGPA